MACDYFDVLPGHPQPQPLEALSGYLIRLAAANAIRYPFHLTTLFFPDSAQNNPSPTTDHLRVSWGDLPRLAACPEERLRQTTFYHLALKFNLALHPNAIGYFLSGSLASYLRYCPLCLQANPSYYRLSWRFLALTGCLEHRCHLLAACPRCGQRVSLLAAPLKIGGCPACGPTLPSAPVVPLSQADLITVQSLTESLAFLLSPQLVDLAPPEMLGPRLACWRQSQNVSLAELAAHLGWSDAYLHLFERRSPGRRFKFSFYLAYSLCLGQPLSILFENERWPPLEPSLYALSPEATQQRQTEILQQVTRAVATLEAKQLPVTQVAICRQVGLSLVTLRRYPQVKAFLTTLAQHRRECRQEQTRRREQELLEQIPTIIATLQSQNRPVTYQAIADQVGLTPTTLNRYLRLHPLLAQVKQAYYQQPQQPLSDPVVPGPPANLVEQVREAIAALQAREQPVTQASLSQFLKWPRAWLRRHPDLVWLTEVYRQDAQTCRQRREQALVAQVQQAIISLTAQGHPLTQPAISQRVGLSVSSLINYPQVRHLLQQAIQFNQEQRRQQTRIREQQLLNRLNLAVIELQAGSTPITKRALSLKVGLSVSALQRYPWLKDRLNQVTKQSAP